MPRQKRRTVSARATYAVVVPNHVANQLADQTGLVDHPPSPLVTTVLLADCLADWSGCALDLIDRKSLAPHREVAGLKIPLGSLNVVGQLGCFGSATAFRDSDEPARWLWQSRRRWRGLGLGHLLARMLTASARALLAFWR
jgi:hypothetical protein